MTWTRKILSWVKFFEKCWNISTRLSIQISGRILKKIAFETQIRNEYMKQETIRSAWWIVPFCWNISTILSINVSSRILKKTLWLVSETQIRNEYMEQETIRSVWLSVFLVEIFQQFWASTNLVESWRKLSD